ncbi:acyltransferase [Amorphus coralli]|uniref:acyltransferase n=1 Tax=Amorphus coralli TaxID=340680 RepID=UPI000378613A|nr:acyltransferase [Amorphus coralli]
MAFYTDDELADLGLGRFGENVLISRKSSLYNPGDISLGSNVRIDDFCVLSAGEGGIEIGDYVHIAVYSSLIGTGRIRICDFCNISSRVSIYSSNDDYSGRSMTNPMVPARFKSVQVDDVFFGKHVIVGSGSVILPGVTLEEGVAIGALSLVKASCAAFGIYAGGRQVGERSRDLLDLEARLLSGQGAPENGEA